MALASTRTTAERAFTRAAGRFDKVATGLYKTFVCAGRGPAHHGARERCCAARASRDLSLVYVSSPCLTTIDWVCFRSFLDSVSCAPSCWERVPREKTPSSAAMPTKAAQTTPAATRASAVTPAWVAAAPARHPAAPTRRPAARHPAARHPAAPAAHRAARAAAPAAAAPAAPRAATAIKPRANVVGTPFSCAQQTPVSPASASRDQPLIRGVDPSPVRRCAGMDC